MNQHRVKPGGVYRTTNGKFVVVTDIKDDMVTYLVIKAKKISIRSKPGNEYTIKRLSFIGNFYEVDFGLGNLEIW
jgi:hypothetical protein